MIIHEKRRFYEGVCEFYFFLARPQIHCRDRFQTYLYNESRVQGSSCNCPCLSTRTRQFLKVLFSNTTC